MKYFNKPVMVSNSLNKKAFRLSSESIIDKAKVQLGGQSPVFRKISTEDKGKVRLGGQGPIFRS